MGAQWQVHRVSPMWGVPYLAGGAGQEREEGVGTCTNVGRLVREEEGGQGVYDEAGLKKHARTLGEVVGRHSEVSLLPLPGLRGNRFDREASVFCTYPPVAFTLSACFFKGQWLFFT